MLFKKDVFKIEELRAWEDSCSYIKDGGKSKFRLSFFSRLLLKIGLFPKCLNCVRSWLFPPSILLMCSSILLMIFFCYLYLCDVSSLLFSISIFRSLASQCATISLTCFLFRISTFLTHPAVECPS